MDAVIDFSAPASLPALAAYVQRTGTPLVSGTTGYCDEEAARVNALGSYAPVAVSANFSIGVAVLKHLAAEAAALLPDFDIEIIETHHRMKRCAERHGEAPSFSRQPRRHPSDGLRPRRIRTPHSR